jgi:hypothetical protein
VSPHAFVLSEPPPVVHKFFHKWHQKTVRFMILCFFTESVFYVLIGRILVCRKIIKITGVKKLHYSTKTGNIKKELA